MFLVILNYSVLIYLIYLRRCKISYFYSRIKGHKGETTRCGTRSSGITARVDSWSIGARSVIKYDTTINADVVTLYATKGSDDSYGKRIMSYAYIDGKFTIIDTSYPELLL